MWKASKEELVPDLSIQKVLASFSLLDYLLLSQIFPSIFEFTLNSQMPGDQIRGPADAGKGLALTE